MPLLLLAAAVAAAFFIVKKQGPGSSTPGQPSQTSLCAIMDQGIDQATCTKVANAYFEETDVTKLKNLYMQVVPKYPLAATWLAKKISFVTCGISPSPDPHVFPFDPAYAYSSSKLAYGPGIYGLDQTIHQSDADQVRGAMVMTQAQLDQANAKMSLSDFLAGTIANLEKSSLPVASAVLRTRYDWLNSKCGPLAASRTITAGRRYMMVWSNPAGATPVPTVPLVQEFLDLMWGGGFTVVRSVSNDTKATKTVIIFDAAKSAQVDMTKFQPGTTLQDVGQGSIPTTTSGLEIQGALHQFDTRGLEIQGAMHQFDTRGVEIQGAMHQFVTGAVTIPLDPHLPVKAREMVAWSVVNNRNPDQLESLAKFFPDAPHAQYQLNYRAWALRQNPNAG